MHQTRLYPDQTLIRSAEVAELIRRAMLGNLPAAALRDAMLAHPTMAEGLNALFASWVD